MIISIVLVGRIWWFWRKVNRENDEYIGLMIYPVSMVLLYIPAIADTVVLAIFGEEVFWLIALHIGSVRLGGFVNMIIYGRRVLKAASKARKKNRKEKKMNMDSNAGINSSSFTSDEYLEPNSGN